MELVAIRRYPVKSLQGEDLAAVEVEVDGLLGDRRWGIRDERTGRILTARRRPELLEGSATYDGDLPVITLPDGRRAEGPGPHTDGLLSQWLGSAVTLVSAAAEEPGRAEYFTDATDDTSRAVEWTMPARRYVDASPVLVLTTPSLRTGAALHPEGDWDARRFRPNLLVDAAGADWLEDGWVGRQLRVGPVTLVPTLRCVRCTMVTRAQPGLPSDVEVFRTLARRHGGLFGVWSEVRTTGAVSVGDEAVVG